MDLTHTLGLGLLAGATIVLGLPVGRLRSPRHSRATAAFRVYLTAASVGVLVFILWDVLAQAWEIITAGLGQAGQPGGGQLIGPLELAVLLCAGLGLGLGGLAGFERWLTRQRLHPAARSVTTLAAILGGPAPATTPGTTVSQDTSFAAGVRRLSPAHRLSLLIAVGIGLHNFGEGLAIGSSAATHQLTVLTLLVVGFALHNATEGFGIIAPLAADPARPSWGFLLAMGAIGGGPTLLGTIVGSQFTAAPMSLLFLTVAAGSILYVIIQLVGTAVRGTQLSAMYWGIWTGLVAGFTTDLILTAGGA